MKKFAALAGFVLSTWTHSAHAAAPAVEDLLVRDWYEIEFFVFERSAVLDANTREVLAGGAPLAYPSNMVAYRAPGEAIGAAYDIDPATRLCMVYPTLDYSIELPETEAAEVDELLPPPAISPVLEAQPQLELLAAVADFEDELQGRQRMWLPPESFALTREARLVARRGGGRVLFHGRWLQAVPPRSNPEPILLQAGEDLGDRAELMGTVNVTLGRYLHFEVQLNYSAPLLGAVPQRFAMRDDGSLIALEPAPPAASFMTMAQSRRMRSAELHYLDHPKLGVVVQIDPVSVPEELTTLLDALQEDVE